MAQTSLARWSIPLEQQLNDTFYYDPAWLDLISSLYRYSLIPLSTTDKEGQIISFLPLCFMQSPLTGKRLVSLPFSDYCPLLALDESGANALIDQAIDLTQQQKARYLELRTGRNDILE